MSKIMQGRYSALATVAILVLAIHAPAQVTPIVATPINASTLLEAPKQVPGSFPTLEPFAGIAPPYRPSEPPVNLIRVEINTEPDALAPLSVTVLGVVVRFQQVDALGNPVAPWGWDNTAPFIWTQEHFLELPPLPGSADTWQSTYPIPPFWWTWVAPWCASLRLDVVAFVIEPTTGAVIEVVMPVGMVIPDV